MPHWNRNHRIAYVGAVYVVFGAAGGIGSELCTRLVRQQGATVVMVGRDQGRLDALKGRLGAGETMVADVVDAKQVRLQD
jgi:NADP-dependent 3-hydroxy acid dehydrogenase YdfG